MRLSSNPTPNSLDHHVAGVRRTGRPPSVRIDRDYLLFLPGSSGSICLKRPERVARRAHLQSARPERSAETHRASVVGQSTGADGSRQSAAGSGALRLALLRNRHPEVRNSGRVEPDREFPIRRRCGELRVGAQSRTRSRRGRSNRSMHTFGPLHQGRVCDSVFVAGKSDPPSSQRR